MLPSAGSDSPVTLEKKISIRRIVIRIPLTRWIWIIDFDSFEYPEECISVYCIFIHKLGMCL